MKAIIQTDEENRVALAFIERLMALDPEKESDEGKLLSLLADVIVIYEKKYDSPPQEDSTIQQQTVSAPTPPVSE